MKKQFAVLGLGSFGKSVAITLERLGCDVIVMDKSFEKVQEISDDVAYAMQADVSEGEALRTLGNKNLDGVVIAVSDSLETSIMATIICKEIGVPYVLAKAKDSLQGKILKKVGADAIVYPESDMGLRTARKLMSSEFLDWIELSPEYSMIEKKLPSQWAGKSLAELGVREKYGLNVVGVIQNGAVNITPQPDMPLAEDCVLILLGANDMLEKFDRS